jgi:hypothetical protein
MHSRLRRVFLTALILLTLPLLASCAYHFAAAKRALPGGYNRLSIPIFKNRTSEPGIESFFTKAMIEELERNKYAEITTGDDAQVILEGEITGLTYVRGASTEVPNIKVQLATEYRVVISTAVRLVRRSDQKVLWEGLFSGEKQYPAPRITMENLNSANAIYNHSAQLQNIAVLARSMMAQAHSQMTENF